MNDVVQKPKELIIYELLQGRKIFTKQERNRFYQARSGYEGELYFSQLLLEHVRSNYIVLYSILFERDGSISQIDCLLIFATKIVLVEIKNFSGEFTFFDDQFQSIRSKKIYQNPLHQLNRTEVNLQHILNDSDVRLPVESYVAFVNDKFTLYTIPSKKVILPTQLMGFLQYLNNEPIEVGGVHFELANRLRSMQIVDNPFEKIPSYEWGQLRKGLFCVCSGNPMKRYRNYVKCSHCSYLGSTKFIIFDSVRTMKILFPTENITTQRVFEWLGGEYSERTIRRYLSTEYIMQLKKSRSYYYELDKK